LEDREAEEKCPLPVIVSKVDEDAEQNDQKNVLDSQAQAIHGIGHRHC
jgi:hypothetical protein